MAGITEAGEAKAWEMLSRIEPGEVCDAAAVSFDDYSGSYTVRSFGMDFTVSLRDRIITSDDPRGDLLLNRLGDFFRLSVLWYLVTSKDIPCTGKIVKLEGISGGDIFTKGSHVLPLEKLSNKYRTDREGFLRKGRTLGGEVVNSGDAGVKLFPFPRVPAVLTLLLEDEEFPARADLLFDSTSALQVPTDIIWSIAMLTVLVML